MSSLLKSVQNWGASVTRESKENAFKAPDSGIGPLLIQITRYRNFYSSDGQRSFLLSGVSLQPPDSAVAFSSEALYLLPQVSPVEMTAFVPRRGPRLLFLVLCEDAGPWCPVPQSSTWIFMQQHSPIAGERSGTDMCPGREKWDSGRGHV